MTWQSAGAARSVERKACSTSLIRVYRLLHERMALLLAPSWPAVAGRSRVVCVRASSSATRVSFCPALPAAFAASRAQRARQLPVAHARKKAGVRALEEAPATPPDSGSFLFGASWAGLVAYVALWAPNQTPARDAYFLEKLVGLGVDDGVSLNVVFFCLFNLMGVWPAVYAALLTPSGRSANGVPAWPFLTGSVAAGAFALLPYMALWSPPQPQPLASLAEVEEAGGVGGVARKALESRLTAAVLLCATLGLVGTASLAGDVAWLDFSRLFKESRLVHVTSVDFLTLSLCAPFWVYNDASARGYKSPLLLPLALTPLLGPVLYLNLRPRSE